MSIISVTLAAIIIPINKQLPHIKFIPIVNVENNTMNGPGQRPPIPQPSPKIKAPKTSLKSISLTCGLNKVYPNIGFPRCLIIYWKVIKFTKSPEPSTNIKAGFH